jgi:peroxiredoxin
MTRGRTPSTEAAVERISKTDAQMNHQHYAVRMATSSKMRELGSSMPPFGLVDTRNGTTVTDADLRDHLSVVAFICNHCPYVIHLKDELSAFGTYCATEGVKMVAISANDPQSHPDDAPEKMKQDAELHAYPFPYLFDATQRVALAFDAVCTPEFFVFDRAGRLAYRGQFDSSRPGKGTPSGEDLRTAVDALLKGEMPNPVQKPSIGCSIKWRRENDPNA